MSSRPFKTKRITHKMFVVSMNKGTPNKNNSKKNMFLVHQPQTKNTIIFHNNQPLQNHLKENQINIINKVKLNDAKIKKRIKFRFSITKPNPLLEKKLKKAKEIKSKHKRNNLCNSVGNQSKKECSFETGRWKIDEHQRFVEAIIKYGNDWKQVQKCVGTRSSTQARSHAQKFFIKIKKAKLLSFNLDLSKASIKMLHDLLADMSSEEYEKILQDLNDVAFDRKGNSFGKRRKSQSKSMVNTDTTDQEQLGTGNNDNDLYGFNSDQEIRSRKVSLDFISERRRNRNSINSIDGFYNNSINNLLIDEKGDKFLVYEHETQINDKEYANNFNLAFRSDNKQLFDNEDVNVNYKKRPSSRKVSQEDDFLFNYMMH